MGVKHTERRVVPPALRRGRGVLTASAAVVALLNEGFAENNMGYLFHLTTFVEGEVAGHGEIQGFARAVWKCDGVYTAAGTSLDLAGAAEQTVVVGEITLDGTFLAGESFTVPLAPGGARTRWCRAWRARAW